MDAKTTKTTVKNFTGQSVQVTLTPDERYGRTDYKVHTLDGKFLGTIESYTGHTDLTPRANTRRDSKAKTLWSANNPKGRPDFIEYSSRAAALRSLIFTY